MRQPGTRYCRWVDRRAGAIGDPIAKLRYLQGAMDYSDRPGKGVWWRRCAPIAVAAILAWPLPTVSEGSPDETPLQPAGQFETAAIPAGLARSDGPAEPETAPNVWLVEDSRGYEVYSNGLRVENKYTVGNEKRPYPVYDRQSLELTGWQTGPVGIIYHTTESHQAPFSQVNNGRLQRVGRWLLEYVQRKRAYHFVIDRFGRVHRIVQETDSANHAGYSIWADDSRVYVNLNPSFIGISFETETENTAEGATINAAQIHAARVLTEMLRSRFGIAASNCVTHAQVSVFSRTMNVGNHMDWAASFPFAEIGLGDNYARPLAAVAVFGFRYGPEYLKASSPAFWRGVVLGEDEFRKLAAGRGATVEACRVVRQKRYQKILEVIEETVSSQEPNEGRPRRSYQAGNASGRGPGSASGASP